MKTFIISLITVCLFAFTACEKNNSISSPADGTTAITTDSLTSLSTLKGEKGGILSATSANDIPSRYFKTANMFKSAYIHIKQYSGECSWTNYVLCAGAIFHGYGDYYTVSHTKITAVKNWCGSSYIERLRDYANAKDYSVFGSVFLSKQSKTSAGRFNTVKYMLHHIMYYEYPLIVISSVNGLGHYLIVWDIDWKCGGTGSTVYYTNSLDAPAGSFSAQLRSMSLTTLLDNMGPNNNSTSSYCALFLR